MHAVAYSSYELTGIFNKNTTCLDEPHLLTTACLHNTSDEIACPSPFVALPKAFADYQGQLWDPLSVPIGLDINDAGYACGGVGIGSSTSGVPRGQSEGGLAGVNEMGGPMAERCFHVFGETLGLFVLDARQGSAVLQVR